MAKRWNIAGIAALLVIAFFIGTFTTWDLFPNLDTYGVTVGTNNTYCSADSVDWTPMISCERAP